MTDVAVSPAEPWVPTDSFANRLVLIRNELRLSQIDAANRCGLDDGSWSNWERGSKPRDMERVVRAIASNLGVNRDWLMWGTAIGYLSERTLSTVVAPSGQMVMWEADPDSWLKRPELQAVASE